jgi:hypothetical protein
MVTKTEAQNLEWQPNESSERKVTWKDIHVTIALAPGWDKHFRCIEYPDFDTASVSTSDLQI